MPVDIYRGDRGLARTTIEIGQKRLYRGSRAFRQDLYAAISGIAYISHKAQGPGTTEHKGPKTYPLNIATHQGMQLHKVG